MGKNNFNRYFFFWIDKLQINKKERISITVLLGVITVLLLINILVKENIVPTPENHAELLVEFERRSELIRQQNKEIEEKYNSDTVAGSNKIKQSKVPIPYQEHISINEGSLKELEKLPGIGNSYAQRIIEYRETNGDFKSVEDLINVKGIGEKTLEKLKPFIKL